MQGVTTAIVLFIFVGLILPSLIQNRNQYYVAFITVIGIIGIDAVAHMIPGSAAAAQAVCYVLEALGQILAVVMLFLATGGLTFRALQGDMIEVLRRGSEEKEVIIPLSEEAKQTIRRNQEEAARRAARDEALPQTHTIDAGSPVAPAAGTVTPPVRPVTRPPSGSGPLPLE